MVCERWIKLEVLRSPSQLGNSVRTTSFLEKPNRPVEQKKCGDTPENEGFFGTWKSPWKCIKETHLKQITFIFLGLQHVKFPGCLFDFSEEMIQFDKLFLKWVGSTSQQNIAVKKSGGEVAFKRRSCVQNPVGSQQNMDGLDLYFFKEISGDGFRNLSGWKVMWGKLLAWFTIFACFWGVFYYFDPMGFITIKALFGEYVGHFFHGRSESKF